MGRSNETYGKKEVRNKQAKKRKEKEARRLQKKEQRGGEKKMEDMIAYVDEYGVISSTPPGKQTNPKADDDVFDNRNIERTENNAIRSGIVKKVFQSAGYGFILDLYSNKSIYMRLSDCNENIEVGDTVDFNTEQGAKGLVAKNIKITKTDQS